MSAAFFVSDIHLCSETDPNALKFLGWLNKLSLMKQDASEGPQGPFFLFLLGDIFDLWIGDHKYFVTQYPKIIASLRTLVSQGWSLHYFEGNHDLYLEKFWRNDVGACVEASPRLFSLAGLRVRLEHGDQMNPSDRGYLFLRWLLRLPTIEFLATHLPAKLVSSIGESASAYSRTHTSIRSEIQEFQIREMIHSHAKRQYSKENFDLIISGHIHLQDDFSFELDGKKVRSINLGSWHKSARAFVITETKQEFVEL